MTPAAADGRPLSRHPAADRRQALDWLLAACRAWLLERPEPAPEAPAEALGRMAHCHNVEPLLHHLTVAGWLAAPAPELAERWERSYFETLAANSALLDLAAELVEAGRRAGAGLVVVKGLATAARAYRDLGLRQMSDVDLLCREDALPAVCRAAAGLGFRAGLEDAVYHLKLHHPARAATVEIHFRAYGLIAHGAAFHERGLARAVELQVDDVRLPALAPEMDLVFQLAHLLSHDLRGNLRGYLDLAALLRRGGLDRETTRHQLEESDLEPELALLVAAVEGLFQVPLRGWAAAVPSGFLEDAVRQRLLEIDAHLRPAALDELRARPWRARLAYLRQLLLPPAGRLRALAELEPGLTPATALTRHWRATFSRGWHKLGATADREPRTPEPSLKRRVLRRR